MLRKILGVLLVLFWQTSFSETPHHMGMGGHTNALALVDLSLATDTAVSSGNWSDPATWGGQAPTDGARVVVPAGVSVTVDTIIAERLKTLRIDGQLRFATQSNTELKVDTLVSTLGSRLEIGTAINPVSPEFSSHLIFIDDGPIDTQTDFAQIGRGAILHGQTVIYGDATTSKAALAVHPATGSSQIQLKNAPTGWDVGDQLVITGTTPNDPRSDEIRTIASIQGTTITLDRPLERNHQAPSPDLNVYIANMTRNVLISSENTAVSRRGHVMFMHTLDVDVNYARFEQLGRTDKTRPLDDVIFEFTEDVVGNLSSAPIIFTAIEGERTNIRGRYPVHFHRGGTDPDLIPARMHGSVVFDSPGWGFVLHSGYAHFTDNISYAIQGTGFYTESGDEIGSMVGNIAIRSFNPAFQFDSDGGAIDPDLGFENQEFGNDGDGYWLSGHGVSLINNVSAGSTAHGFIIWSDGLVEADIPRGRTTVKVSEIANGHLIPNRQTIPVWWAPMAEIRGNEAYGSSIGFRARYIHSQTYLGEGGSEFHRPPPQAYIDTLEPTIDGLTVWGNRDGVLLNYTERVSLTNSRIIGIGAPFVFDAGTANSGVGLDQGTEVTRGMGRLENVTIEGFEMGYVAHRNDQYTIKNLTLRNVTDMLITEPRAAPRTLTMENVTFGGLDRTAVAGRDAERRNIVMTASFEAIGYQPFWFVMPDRITLDGNGIYFNEQAASFVPLPQQPDPEELLMPIPGTYVGRNNQQLQNTFGLSFGGAVIPSDARSVSYVNGGVVGSPASAVTVLPTLLDMSSAGDLPEPPMGDTVPELTGNRITIRNGDSITLMATNLNTTDTNTPPASLTYQITELNHGFFVHRDAPTTPITRFTQAQINSGVIRFVHDGSDIAPAYQATVSDGQSTTAPTPATIVFLSSMEQLHGGFSGAWYDLSHDGEGFLLEILDNNIAVVYWFTYDESGNQRWFTASGAIQGNRVQFDQLIVTRGGRFGPDFDPNDVIREDIGSLTLTFTDCNSGAAQYVVNGEAGSQTLTRLTNIQGVDCPMSANSSESGRSGSFSDPMHDGEGLIIHEISANQATIYWFSYDPSGQQRWFFGLADRSIDRLFIDTMQTTSGGLFGPNFDPNQVMNSSWGSATIDFIDCNSALLDYQADNSNFGSGQQSLNRLTRINSLSCQ